MIETKINEQRDTQKSDQCVQLFLIFNHYTETSVMVEKYILWFTIFTLFCEVQKDISLYSISLTLIFQSISSRFHNNYIKLRV